MQSDTRRHLVAVLLLVVGAASANLLWARRPQEVVYQIDFDVVPRQVGELQAETVPVEQRIFDYLGADAMEELMYSGRDRAVRLSLIYGKDWRAVHSPLSCLPQQGWQVHEKRMIEIPAPPGTPHAGPLSGQLLQANKPGNDMLVLYVFAHRGGTTGDWLQQGWAVSESAPGTGGLMLLLSTHMSKNGRAAAEESLKEVLRGVYVPATSFWYS